MLTMWLTPMQQKIRKSVPWSGATINGEEKIITFKDLKIMSDKAANLFSKYGIKKGDTVMLTLKSRWEFWVCMVGLNKIGAISIPSTHMLKAKDFVYRIKKADLKMIICIARERGARRIRCGT